jgi:hypothetical protein
MIRRLFGLIDIIGGIILLFSHTFIFGIVGLTLLLKGALTLV